MKKALITGITGQDGSYLAEYLLGLGYEVHGLVRRTSNDPMERISDMRLGGSLFLHQGNLRDLSTLRLILEEVVPDEIYNLAAQSHVGTSFVCPDETWDINYYGVGRLVNEALKVNPQVKIYQASTSEMFGRTNPPQNELSPFEPVSPYAEAKLKAHEDFIVGYREKYGHFFASGILFNHESPRRGKQFVTRKITHSLAKIKLGLQEAFELGNLDAKRDWGYARDYVEAMHAMMQLDTPEDFVIGTGETRTVREMAEIAAKALGIPIRWEGTGLEEKGILEDGRTVITIYEKFYRPNEVNHLLADATKAKEKLNWIPSVSFEELVSMITEADLALLERSRVDANR